MTPNAWLFRTLSEVCKGTYLSYKPGSAPPLPWFCYSRQNGEEVYADNSNYSRLPRYRVELLFEENDPDLIERFEEALSKLGVWRLYSADYVDSEACLMHDYRLAMNIALFREANDG